MKIIGSIALSNEPTSNFSVGYYFKTMLSPILNIIILQMASKVFFLTLFICCLKLLKYAFLIHFFFDSIVIICLIKIVNNIPIFYLAQKK